LDEEENGHLELTTQTEDLGSPRLKNVCVCVGGVCLSVCLSVSVYLRMSPRVSFPIQQFDMQANQITQACLFDHFETGFLCVALSILEITL